MNISLREFKWASRSSSFMSLADGSEMAFVTLSAVAGGKGGKETLFDSWGVTCLVFPHLDEGLHLGDPLLDGLVHPLPSLHVGSILLVRLKKDNKKSAALLVSYLPLHGWSSSVRRRYRCREPSWSLRTLPSSASPECVRIAFAFLNWRIPTAPRQTSSFLPQGWKHSSYHSSPSPLTWCPTIRKGFNLWLLLGNPGIELLGAVSHVSQVLHVLSKLGRLCNHLSEEKVVWFPNLSQILCWEQWGHPLLCPSSQPW